jgi:hypothetical protein
MNAKKIMILALALSLPTVTLLAQNEGPPDGPPPGGQNDGPPGGGRGHRPPMMPLIQVLDANHDGVLSADEIANAPVALKTLDKNGDGQLSKDEYLPPRPQRGGPGGKHGQGTNAPADAPPPPPDGGKQGDDGHHRPIPPIVTALDTDGDGVISAAEIAGAPAALLKLDKNGDGKLTLEELMGPRPPRRGDGPDGGPDGGGKGQRPPPPDQNQ